MGFWPLPRVMMRKTALRSGYTHNAQLCRLLIRKATSEQSHFLWGRVYEEYLLLTLMTPKLVNQILHFTLIHNHSSSFVIFRDINLDRFSGTFTNFHEKPWKTIRINIAIFRESSWTMMVNSLGLLHHLKPRQSLLSYFYCWKWPQS